MDSTTLLLTTFGGCLIGSFVPLVNTEIVVLSAAALAPSHLIGPLILMAATTQMLAKSVLYFAGGGLLKLPHNRYTSGIHSALARGQTLQNTGSMFLFASASVGLPPFYLTSLASGAVRIPLKRFLTIGFIGRLLRFSVLVMVPQLIKAIA